MNANNLYLVHSTKLIILDEDTYINIKDILYKKKFKFSLKIFNIRYNL